MKRVFQYAALKWITNDVARAINLIKLWLIGCSIGLAARTQAAAAFSQSITNSWPVPIASMARHWLAWWCLAGNLCYLGSLPFDLTTQILHNPRKSTFPNHHKQVAVAWEHVFWIPSRRGEQLPRLKNWVLRKKTDFEKGVSDYIRRYSRLFANSPPPLLLTKLLAAQLNLRRHVSFYTWISVSAQ